MKKEITNTINISELVPDTINANKGNEYGNHLIEASIRQFGLGRSILIDKNNHIIAGNKTTENAAAVGIENVRVIETTGNEIIAVKRMDIDLNTKMGRELALADNATSKANITWDTDAIEKLKENFDIDASGWGVSLTEANTEIDFDNIESNADRNVDKQSKEVTCPECGHKFLA